MINRKTIGNIIQKIRRDNNLIQEELAEKIDISTNYLSKVERGLNVLNTESFLKMAEVLSFSLKDFGIGQSTIEVDSKKEELIKKILSASSSNIEAYTKAINDEIIK